MNLRQGTLLKHGEYRIERELGHGGFGVTYLATQVGLNRRVAIKEFFMSEYCNRDAETSHVSVPSEGSKELVAKFRKKFIKEAQNIACLKHPHIISIHDVFEDNGTAYYVMEYLEYGSLADVVKRQGRLSEADALRYTRQIADALRYIHARKMNHLDVKPGNILIDETDNAVLIDFGLSKRYDNEGKQTSTTPVGISHGYAPLEQYKKSGVGTFSPATDIYSLGATLYKLITGDTPPDANDILTDGLPSHPDVISPAVFAAIEQAMQPNKNNRPQSVEEFMALLDAEVKVEDERTVLDEDLRASLVTPSASQSSARPSINRGTVGSASSHPEGKHQQAPPLSIEGVSVGRGSSKRNAEQTSFSFKKLLWPLLACVVAVVAFFGVRAYNNISAENARLAEEARLAAIEQHHLDSIAKAKEAARKAEEAARLEQHRRDSIAKAEQAQRVAEEKRKEEERIKAEEAKQTQLTGKINGHEWVDLGLSVKWATCNVGASSPSGYGNYYAWGETRAKSSYTEETYTYYENGEYVDIGSNISGTKYDAARANWGGTWRMPTIEEFEELRNKCTWTWTTQGGHNGYRVTGPNGKSIFLPAAGHMKDASLYVAGSIGNYWSATYATYNDIDAWGLGLRSDVHWDFEDDRFAGRTVRPVSD